ncbi:MAG: glycine cleavage system aminomethyltransferase GcvT, partial [Chrysiogenetes bacterium]|nr:glycine cleavage system aminomethyltransferase GcvT [Chrysiogenetes bacterium]
MSEELRRTPLYQAHLDAGAKMVPFSGWEMPVQYAGIAAEHAAVRERAGLFDVSHMGEIEFSGSGALAALQSLLTNDISVLEAGDAQYALLTNERGGIVDDVITYCVEPHEHYLLCVNAGNQFKDFDWIKERIAGFPGVEFRFTSNDWAQIALQGPEAERALTQSFAGAGWEKRVADLKFMKFITAEHEGARIYIARSGYTGEDGFEIFIPADHARLFWDELLNHDAVEPAGLGARDTLRLEAKLPLHGNDIDEDTSPLEAGLGFAVKLGKTAECPGKAVLAKQKEEGVSRKLVGFELTGKGIARHGYPVIVDGKPFGEVRSGTKTPTVGKPIGL